MFHAELYQSRRNQLIQGMANQGLILLLGNGESSLNYTDNTYPFRQDSSFLYFCGIDRPDMALVIDTASGQSTLYADNLSLDYQVWMGVQPTTEVWAQRAGIEKWAPYDQLATDLAKASVIHYLPPYRAENPTGSSLARPQRCL
jgi:Xaa-Pro aminopeptidase